MTRPRKEFSKSVKRANLVGQQFGRLTVSAEAPTRAHRRYFVCDCTCGSTSTVSYSNLTQGQTLSCGCLAIERRTRHSLSGSPEYRAWVNMISRCENPRTPGWRNLGGRGIKVCARWRESFEEFREDMGPRPSPGHSLDRIDSNGNYEPGNCRWATKTAQARNLRTNRIIHFRGEDITLAEAVERLGLNYNTVLYRLRRGKSVAEALQ